MIDLLIYLFIYLFIYLLIYLFFIYSNVSRLIRNVSGVKKARPLCVSKSKLNTALNYCEGYVKTERYQRSYFVIIVTRVNNLGDV